MAGKESTTCFRTCTYERSMRDQSADGSVATVQGDAKERFGSRLDKQFLEKCMLYQGHTLLSAGRLCICDMSLGDCMQQNNVDVWLTRSLFLHSTEVTR